MRVGDRLHLSYCTNVHPGETLAELSDVLRRDVAAVKRRVSPDAPFGLGLRLGNGAATALSSAARRAELAALCQELDLYAFTVNGFPYGDFAAERVKAAVYEPSWLDEERVAYTERVAEALVALPGPPERTISTVAGGFRPTTEGDDAKRRIATNLARAAESLARLADRTGVRVRLCLEPEPWTTLELARDAIELFHQYLFPLGEQVREHLGLCYDCCHQAVYFENPVHTIERLVEAEVPIGKIQVSSALHLATPADPAARAALLAYAEPRYLHQTVARRRDGMLLTALDLPDLRAPDEAWREAEAWRCHFHVPIWWRGAGALGTTRADWEAAVRTAVRLGACDQLEVETYTWHVLPEEERAALEGGNLHACVAAEIAALRAALADSAPHRG